MVACEVKLCHVGQARRHREIGEIIVGEVKPGKRSQPVQECKVGKLISGENQRGQARHVHGQVEARQAVVL